jgi:UDP-N-acetylglucosamine 2-epimerase (non-hydrolysing)
LVTGNTGIDALLYVSTLIDDDPTLLRRMSSRYDFLGRNRNLILVTGHRRESFGDGFERICDGLLAVAQRPNVDVLYPVHLNPIVQSVVRQRLRGQSNIHLIEPVEYVDMVYLMKRAKVIVTDSGGIQEEGPALGRPVLVMRDVTERPEALSTGVVQLIGTVTEPPRPRSLLFLRRNSPHEHYLRRWPWLHRTAGRLDVGQSRSQRGRIRCKPQGGRQRQQGTGSLL